MFELRLGFDSRNCRLCSGRFDDRSGVMEDLWASKKFDTSKGSRPEQRDGKPKRLYV